MDDEEIDELFPEMPWVEDSSKGLPKPYRYKGIQVFQWLKSNASLIGLIVAVAVAL